MVKQDLNKYAQPKYRLVVRFTNTRVIAQVTYATLRGDRILCQADSKELERFGLSTGFTSYAASYATGLLVARRLLQQIGLDSTFKGKRDADGKMYNVVSEAETYKQDRRPFRAILDIGLINSTVGNRVYGALKGACDGGLNIPHNVKKFPGYFKEEGKKRGTYTAENHQSRILGQHIDEYMEKLEEEDKEAYEKQFSKWDACLNKNSLESVGELFKKIHEAIFKDPKRVKKDHKKNPVQYENNEKSVIKTSKGTYTRDRRISLEQRKERVAKKVALAANL